MIAFPTQEMAPEVLILYDVELSRQMLTSRARALVSAAIYPSVGLFVPHSNIAPKRCVLEERRGMKCL